MSYAYLENGGWVLISPRDYGLKIKASLPVASYELHGLHRVATLPRPDVPLGKVAALSVVPSDQGGKPVFVWLVQDVATPSAETLYPDAASARRVMVGWIDRLTSKITDQYPVAEVSSWPAKAEAARAVVAGSARPDQVAMIRDEASLTGQGVTDQAAAIIAKAVIYEAIISKVSGFRQATDAALSLATTPAQREGVIAAAKVQAAAMSAAYGL